MFNNQSGMSPKQRQFQNQAKHQDEWRGEMEGAMDAGPSWGYPYAQQYRDMAPEHNPFMNPFPYPSAHVQPPVLQSPYRYPQVPQVSDPPPPYNHVPHLGVCPIGLPLSRLHRSGPPILPKRTDYTCWVGNLPPNATVEMLRDHFSDGAKDDIESIFLMMRNCAFVNYSTESACHAAVQRLNGKLLGGNPLLCRVKKEQSDEDEMFQRQGHDRQDSGAADVQVNALSDTVKDLKVDEPEASEKQDTVPENLPRTDSDPTKTTPEKWEARYFILKALNTEDLQESYRTGTWTTQLHVQKKLHKAFKNSESVYLIFSVNKSGTYFGYAKMLSSPGKGQQATREIFDGNLFAGLQVLQTPETERVPAGKITYDPARSTRFWEAVRDPDSETEGPDDLRPFRVQWITNSPLPFDRVRGLKNQWNLNKEVKVARDGTELETTAGRRLLALMNSVSVDYSGARRIYSQSPIYYEVG
ncbi:hypothetical protein CKM354_001074300 [Cercospora kikuchii]|uniref:YTH domain-containing protein n=1 Tax=Cercospora kikuchii TaxID=84275 RepID=A0A9P3FHE7_9PEZI|nr:uncharacterized protein CKM354_001074300 [Cercospora kikuchii]GIZ47658.1 hypothetical protein CKM354_001074300 [Cercospora kikuchii]